MLDSASEKSTDLQYSTSHQVCDFNYLAEVMGNKNHLIRGIMEAFLKQVPEELERIRAAISGAEFTLIKNLAHTMKSSMSIMGISSIIPLLNEMEELGADGSNMKLIIILNARLDQVCNQAIAEVERARVIYV